MWFRLTFISLFLVSLPAFAHTFWIERETILEADQTITAFSLRIGDPFLGEEYARNPGHIRDFSFRPSEQSTIPIPGRPGRKPAGFLVTSSDPRGVVVYASNATKTTLEPDKFKVYLHEEKIDDLVMTTSKEPINESFTRFAKIILTGKNEKPAKMDFAIGMPLEIVFRLSTDTKSYFMELLLHGKPCTNRVIFLSRRDGPTIELRTNDKGRTQEFNLEPGQYLARSTYIQSSPKEDLDYESYWATNRFETTNKE